MPWSPPLAAATIFLLFLLLGAVVARRVALLRAARSPAVVELAPDGRFELTLRDGTRVEGPAGPRHVTRYWVALRCGTPPGGAMLVVADMLPADAFRRMRLWALWSGAPGDSGPVPT